MDREPTARKKSPRAWDALTPPLAEWILDAVSSMGYAQATPVQKATFDFFRGNKDVVVEAVTGSGKTLAYLIPTVERILRSDEPTKRNHIKAVIISPTRELATQIHGVLVNLLAFHPASAELLPYAKSDERRPDSAGQVVVPQLCVGGTVKAADDLRAFLRLSPNLVIGTPGRLAELLSSPHVKTPSTTFECLVLDEADRLLDMGFQDSLSRILGFLPKTRRTGLFSASVNDAVQEIIRVGLLYPHKITVRVKTLAKDQNGTGNVVVDKKTPASLDLRYHVVKASEKLPALCQLLADLQPRPQRAIAFVSSCAAVRYFGRILPAAGLLPPGWALVALHGKLEPKARQRALARFLAATSPTLLLTTDVAARGLDVQQVDFVAQLDPPTDARNFIHRAGRAGRAGRRGLAVVFLHPGPEEGYAPFLAARGTPVSALTATLPGMPPVPVPRVQPEDVARAAAATRALARADRDVFAAAQRAFVSWVRSYLEHHQASAVFRVDSLDWADLAAGWGLLELPRMPELRGVEGLDRSLGLGVDTAAIPFADAARERKRLAETAAAEERRASGLQEKARERRRRNGEAWSAKREREDGRAARREKKRRKKEVERLESMTEQERGEHAKLEEMVATVRRNVAAAHSDGKEEFEGFDD